MGENAAQTPAGWAAATGHFDEWWCGVQLRVGPTDARPVLPEWARRTGARLFPAPPPLREGPHPDPADPSATRPEGATRSRLWRSALASAETRLLRECLALPGNDDIRAAVLDDLSTHSGLTPEECVTRCIHWEEASVEEWFEADRTDPSAVNAFYRTTQSWLFDLLWYAYLQADGFALPTHVLTLRLAQAHATGRTHLDFGSGVGITSQLFARAGYDTALADVSDSLLEFARHRLARRGDDASFVNLNADAIAPALYDVITAVDTLVCIDDLGPVARSLHAALRPGGCLIANLYPRPRSPEIGWEVYDDAALPRFAITSAGFVPVARCDTFTVYRSVDPASPAHRLRTVRDRTLLTSRARQVLHRQNVRLAAALRGQPLATV